MDVIRLKNMTFYGYHGVSAAEKETGRRYEVDCDLHLDLSLPARTDKLADTANYEKVYRIVEQVLNGKRYSLLEAIAYQIAEQVLQIDNIQEVAVRVRKLIPPIPGNLDHIEVEVRRARG